MRLLLESAASESVQMVVANICGQLRLRGRDVCNRPAFVLLYGRCKIGVDFASMGPGAHRCHTLDLSAFIDIASRDYEEVGIPGN